MALDDLIFEEMLKEEQAKMGTSPATAEVPPEEVVTPSQVMQALKPAVLPTVGSALGTLGGLAAAPISPFATPVLEALGGMGGEALNQALGITAPSMSAIGEQGLLPIAMRGGAFAKRIVPGASKGAQLLHEIAPVEVRNRLSRVAASAPATSKEMFARAEASKARIPAPEARLTINNEIDTALTGGAGSDLYKPTVKYLQRLESKIRKNPEGLTPTEYQTELRDLNARITGAEGRKLNQVEFKSLMNVKDSLTKALEAAPAGSDLAQARQLYHRERVLGDLDELTFKAEKIKQGESLSPFNASEVLRKIEKDEKFSRRFKTAFTPGERKEITDIYKLLNKIPPLQSDIMATRRLLTDFAQGAALGSVAHLAGASPTTTATASAIGALSRPAMDIARVFKLAMSTDEGRRVLLKELTARKDKPLREVLQKVAVGISATQPAQDFTREIAGTPTQVRPFPEMR